MMQRFALFVFACIASLIAQGQVAHADSLEIRPTIYQDIHLGKGERKKAYVDVLNPTATKQTVTMKAQAFRQTDDSGGLAFRDNEQVAKGVKLDLSEFELAPHEAIRVFFLLDGTILPSGDVFAAIFAESTPAAQAAAQAVRVGTLLTITNGTPSSHVADVEDLSVGFFQVGEAITARFLLHNPADETRATGFFPNVTVKMSPYATRQVKGPLLFAGRTRTIDYRQAGDYFGFVTIRVDAGGVAKSRIIFAVTGYWHWLAPLILACLGTGIFIVKKLGLNIAFKKQ